MKNRKGFTLAEIIITMAIVVIMAAAAIPSMGGAMEAARNKDRETRVSAAIYDAFLDALKDGGSAVEVSMPDGILDDMRNYVKSETLSVSFGEKTVAVNNVPTNADALKCEFVKSGTFQLSRIIFYSGESELSSIFAT